MPTDPGLAPKRPTGFMNDRISVCWLCTQPLVSCLAVRFAEWHCLGCGQHYALFDAARVDATETLWQRWDELTEQHKTATCRVSADTGVTE